MRSHFLRITGVFLLAAKTLSVFAQVDPQVALTYDGEGIVALKQAVDLNKGCDGKPVLPMPYTLFFLGHWPSDYYTSSGVTDGKSVYIEASDEALEENEESANIGIVISKKFQWLNTHRVFQSSQIVVH